MVQIVLLTRRQVAGSLAAHYCPLQPVHGPDELVHRDAYAMGP